MEKHQHKQMSEASYLAQYQAEQKQYEKPSVTVDIALFGVGDKKEEAKGERKRPELGLKVLLVKRGQHPYMGKWAMVGGFMGITETLDEAVARELEEETGVTNVYMEQLYTWSDVNRDSRMRILSASYLALVDRAKHDPVAQDDVDEAKWFTLEEQRKVVHAEKEEANGEVKRVENVTLVFTSEDGEDVLQVNLDHITTYNRYGEKEAYNVTENSDIAFDHAKILYYSLLRLRNKVGYTDIIFDLMPEKFTLSMLKEVYEAIIGDKVNNITFRRLMLGKMDEVIGEKYTKGYRPTTLYRYNPYKSFRDKYKK